MIPGASHIEIMEFLPGYIRRLIEKEKQLLANPLDIVKVAFKSLKGREGVYGIECDPTVPDNKYIATISKHTKRDSVSHVMEGNDAHEAALRLLLFVSGIESSH
jgi:hypothetical protein